MKIKRIGLALVLLGAVNGVQARHCDGTTSGNSFAADALASLSLDALMDIEITSLNKKAEVLSEVPAPVFVITHEDIHRSGVTNIADALRMAPGVQVGRMNSHAWAVSIRGFDSFFANKLQVLVDGRSVYQPTFGGVYWDMVDTLLEDIERIEVIRGPAGTVWGSNAVNGVINIITRCASDTQGAYLTAALGDEDQAYVGARYGGKLGEHGHFRVHAKGHDRDDFESAATFLDDDWYARQAGFRADFDIGSHDSVRISGDTFDNRNRTADFLAFRSVTEDVDGGNLLASWEHRSGENSGWRLQAYYDRNHRDSPVADIEVETYDIDFQHHFGWGHDNEFTWGLGYRDISDDIEDRPNNRFVPPEEDYDLQTLFVQNESRFMQGDLRLVLGAKFEHNDFTGTETQPTARLIWFPSGKTSVWASASRAVHIVSRAYTSIVSTTLVSPAAPVPFPPFALPLYAQAQGSPTLDSDHAEVFEIGARGEINDRLTWDLALFRARYDDLLDTTTSLPAFDPVLGGLVVTITGKNEAKATTQGAELSVKWQPTDRVRVQGSYSYLDVDADSADDPAFETDLEGRAPRHQLSLRTGVDVRKDVDLDLWLRYVDDTFSTTSGKVDEHWGLDARLAWRPRDNIELSLVGQNLLEPHHLEFGPEGNNLHSTEVERNIYAQIRWLIR